MVRPVVALAAAALLSGCGAVHPMASTSASSSSVVPWLPLAPDLSPIPVASPQALPVPPGTPTCSSADLQAKVVGSNGATGHVLTFFGLSNRGSQACQVEGTPAITLLDAAGHDLGFKNRAPYFPDEVSGPALIDPGPGPEQGVGLKYGMVGLTIDWISQPEMCPGDPAAKVAAARIDIAGVGSVSVTVPDEPAGYACQGVGVGDLAGPAVEVEAPAEPPLPNATITAPAAVKAGATLHYVVTLNNPTVKPIDLRTNCPNYEEELFADLVNGSPPLGGKHLFQLNCKAAGVLMPAQSMKFAMELPVPGLTAPGRYTLIFDLGRSNAMTEIAPTASLNIT